MVFSLKRKGECEMIPMYIREVIPIILEVWKLDNQSKERHRCGSSPVQIAALNAVGVASRKINAVGLALLISISSPFVPLIKMKNSGEKVQRHRRRPAPREKIRVRSNRFSGAYDALPLIEMFEFVCFPVFIFRNGSADLNHAAVAVALVIVNHLRLIGKNHLCRKQGKLL